jgi:hypothetical protein
MRRTVIAVGLSLAWVTIALAQTGQKQVYACMEQDSNGFSHGQGGYKPARFNIDKYLISISGNTLSGNFYGRNRSFSCSSQYEQHMLLCTSGFSVFTVNLKTLNFVRAQVYGPVDDSTDTTRRDSLSVSYGSCQKF